MMKLLKFEPIAHFYKKSNKVIATSANKEWCDNNMFQVFEDDAEVEEKNEDKMEKK